MSNEEIERAIMDEQEHIKSQKYNINLLETFMDNVTKVAKIPMPQQVRQDILDRIDLAYRNIKDCTNRIERLEKWRHRHVR